MNAFNKLESACRVAVSFKSFNEIEIGAYNVTEFKFMDTRFGKKIVVVTEDFMAFLPDRFSKAITTDEEIAELNSEQTIMLYGGRDAKRMNRIMVEFQKVPQETYQHDAQQWTIPDCYVQQILSANLGQALPGTSSNLGEVLPLNMDQNLPSSVGKILQPNMEQVLPPNVEQE